jgi:hypothetical protein
MDGRTPEETGSEDEAAELLDAYLARADTAARLAQVTTA